MFTWIRCYSLILKQSLLEVLAWKRNLFFLIAALLVVVITAFLIRQAGDRDDNNDLFGWMLAIPWLQLLVPITAVYFSTALLRDEIGNRTILYLLAGPVPRSSIWMAKYSASVLVSLVIVLGGYTICAGVSHVVSGMVASRADERLAGSTIQAGYLLLVLGPFAYAAVGTLLAIRFRWAILWGAAFFLVWETFVGSLPSQTGLRSATIADSLRTLLYHNTPEADGLHRGLFRWTGAGRRFGEDIPTSSDALITLLCFTAIPLLLTIWIGHGRDFETGAKDD